MFERSQEVRDALREANYAFRSRHKVVDKTVESTLFAMLLATIAAALYLSRF